MHDVTALRTDGIEDLLRRHPGVRAEVDAGYQGLARDFPGQVSAPPEKPGKDAPPEETARWERQRHQQSSQRICIEHAIAEPRQWRALQRWTGRRAYFRETALAIAGLVSDRAAAVITHQPARQASTRRPQSCTYSLDPSGADAKNVYRSRYFSPDCASTTQEPMLARVS
jgi:hypothetical protein